MTSAILVAFWSCESLFYCYTCITHTYQKCCLLILTFVFKTCECLLFYFCLYSLFFYSLSVYILSSLFFGFSLSGVFIANYLHNIIYGMKTVISKKSYQQTKAVKCVTQHDADPEHWKYFGTNTDIFTAVYTKQISSGTQNVPVT